MAEILNLGFVRHLRAETSSHILYHRGVKAVRSGRGLSFWFLPLSASVAEVPVDDRELSLVIHGRSADFQDVAVQGVLTWRVLDPAKLAERVDFTLDLSSGAFLRQPLEKLALQLSALAQQQALGFIARTPIRELLSHGHVHLREVISEGLRVDPALPEMGLSVVSVRIASVRPKPELEKALEAPVRERIQQESDEAAFARRALAVEKERAIRENELQNQIELARREEQLIAQRGQNGRRQATEEAEAGRIATEAQAQRTRIEAEAAAEATQVQGRAEGERVRAVEGAHVEVERERMDVYREVPASVMAGLAARELAGKLERIDHLNLGPDILGPMLQRLMDAGTKRLSPEG